MTISEGREAHVEGIDDDACMEAFTRKNVGRITISC